MNEYRNGHEVGLRDQSKEEMAKEDEEEKLRKSGR